MYLATQPVSQSTFRQASLPATLTTATSPRLWPEPDVELYDRWPIETIPAPRNAPILQVEIGGRHLAYPLLVSIGYQDGCYEIEHQELALFGRGVSQEEAMRDFLDYLIADYHAYAEEDDANLDDQARELAGRYRKLFGSR